MNRCVRMLAGMLFVGALAGGAKAQVPDQVTVNVPYSFVVGDKTLPAGNYRVDRISFSNDKELAIIGADNKSGVLVVSSETEGVRNSAPKFVFEKIGEEHVLIKIQTAEHVFELPVSHSAILLATAKTHPAAGGSASGTD